MSFPEKHAQIVARIEKVSEAKLYLKTFFFSVLTFILLFAYYYLDKGSLDIYDINSLFALNATVLICISLALSGLCYFWNFVDAKIVYRKFLGIIGFAYAVAHAVASVTNYFLISNAPKPAFDVYHIWVIGGVSISNIYAFAAAVFALIIFIIMAAISNRYAVLELGGVRWRQLLRTGYVAIVFVGIHFGIKRADLWINWFQGNAGKIPHISLPILILVLLVILLRIALSVSQRLKKRKAGPRIVKVMTVNSPVSESAIKPVEEETITSAGANLTEPALIVGEKQEAEQTPDSAK